MDRNLQRKDELARGKLQKALIFLKSGKITEAIRKAERSLRFFQHPQAFIIKGLAELKGQNFTKAKDSLIIGISELEPHLQQQSCENKKIQIYTKACIGLGWCLLKQGNLKMCRQYLQKATLFLSFAQIDGKEEAKRLEEKLKKRQWLCNIIEKKEKLFHRFSEAPSEKIRNHSVERFQPIQEIKSKVDSLLTDQQQDLKCPLTCLLFKDPVVALDGFTYERYAIQEWFKKSLTSPMTNQQLNSNILIPNLTLKKLVQSQIERLSKKEAKYKSDNDDLSNISKEAQLKLKKESEKKSERIHYVQCSQCDIFPIIGI